MLYVVTVVLHVDANGFVGTHYRSAIYNQTVLALCSLQLNA